ncbi:hypothetical protein PoB_004319800 [Plakobranchus ocellatus]|uniref:Uncharacterized protein n=1 Tax=Plakobranchus ocellatus TaxID=259542 RepID=A0AAV4BCS9_9GAST|nr:hypothetical protein PoB_004319800 [Plakobranchus ocellatus]
MFRRSDLMLEKRLIAVKFNLIAHSLITTMAGPTNLKLCLSVQDRALTPGPKAPQPTSTLDSFNPSSLAPVGRNNEHTMESVSMI